MRRGWISLVRVRVLVLVAGACTSAHAPSPPSPPPPPASPVRSDELARWPDDAVTVGEVGHDGAIIEYIRSLYTDVHRVAAPHCIDELTSHIDAQYQLELGDDRAQAQIFVGAFDRDAIDRCLRIVGNGFREAGYRLDVDRDGDLTRITQVLRDTKVGWLMATPTEVVVTGDPARTRAIAANAHPMAPDAPLAQLWRRTSGEMRMATVLDYSTGPLGVRSTGWIVSLHTGEVRLTKRVLVRVQYASEDDAKRALAALAAKPAQPGSSPAIARVVELLAGYRDGREVVIDVGGLMRAPDGLAAAQAALGMPQR